MTIEERLENMEGELERMKRRNRWLLGAILLVAGVLIVSVVLETTASRARAQAGGTAKVIRANGFVLEDENGKPRAALGVGKSAPASLILFDENGKMRVFLAVGKEGASLTLGDEKGQARFAAGWTVTVTPDGKTIEYPESSLILFGPDGKIIWSAIK
jgi:hypothetical protein